MKKMSLAALLALTVAAPAFAADFAGPSIEGHLGWDRARARVSYADEALSGHDTGLLYGLGIGYDYRIGKAVIGAFASIDDSTVKSCLSIDTESACLKGGRDIEVGARLGYVVTPRALIYAKAAYANGRASISYRDAAAPADGFSDHSDRDGFRLGAGVEYSIVPHAYVKAEYRYTDYKNLRADLAGDEISLGLSRHQVLGAIGYRF